MIVTTKGWNLGFIARKRLFIISSCSLRSLEVNDYNYCVNAFDAIKKINKKVLKLCQKNGT